MPTTPTIKIAGVCEPEEARYLAVEVDDGLRGYVLIGPEWWEHWGNEMHEVTGAELAALKAAWAEHQAGRRNDVVPGFAGIAPMLDFSRQGGR